MAPATVDLTRRRREGREEGRKEGKEKWGARKEEEGEEAIYVRFGRKGDRVRVSASLDFVSFLYSPRVKQLFS